jgi:Tol biopolymer transport system component
MKKVLLLLVVSVQFLFAQQIHVKTVEKIAVPNNLGLHHPIFSPAGDYLLATTENFSGLQLYSFDTKTFTTITTDAGAGYGVQISEDGNSVLYRRTELLNQLKFSSLMEYSRTNAKAKQLVSPTREAISAKFVANKPMYLKSKRLVRNNISSAEASPLIAIENQKMVIYNANSQKTIAPNGQNASYFWASISPNKKNIVYTVAGKGTFVCNIDGTNPIPLGKLGAPVWLNNTWIVGMDDKDDGEKLLSSQLVATNINAKTRQTITTPIGIMAMYPATSADGSKIAFNTEKGEMYLLNIEIK